MKRTAIAQEAQLSRWLELRMLEMVRDLLEAEMKTQVVIYLDGDDHPMHVENLGEVVPGNDYEFTVKPVHERIDKLLVAVRLEFRDEYEDCLASQIFAPAGIHYKLRWRAPSRDRIHYTR